MEVSKDNTYYGIVFVNIDRYYNKDDLKLDIDGEEKELFPVGELWGGLYEDYYCADVGEFSRDVKIKFKGQTQIKTYNPTVTLSKYDDNKNEYNCQNVRFTVSIGTEKTNYVGDISLDNEEAFNYETYSYNGKTTFTLEEFEDAINNKSLTWLQHFKIVVLLDGKDLSDSSTDIFTGNDSDIHFSYDAPNTIFIHNPESVNNLTINCDVLAQI